MNSHFHLPKIRTFRFSLHTSRPSLHGEVTIVALKFAMSSHFPLPKFFSPSLFPLFQMARAARRVIENPRQMNPAQSYIVREVLLVREREREIQREREKDGSDVTIVALKLAMNLLAMSLHFPLAKIRTFRFSLHTSPLSLHHDGGAEIRIEFTLSIAKKNFALRLCSPSFK